MRRKVKYISNLKQTSIISRGDLIVFAGNTKPTMIAVEDICRGDRIIVDHNLIYPVDHKGELLLLDALKKK